MIQPLAHRIRFILVGTTHPGNIGAAARAMKNMGFGRLYLVAPKLFPHHSATERAAGADELLAAAVVTETLDEALAGCGLVIGTSARTRALPLEELDPRRCAETIAQYPDAQDIALVFGREHAGLTNDELYRCHYQIHIPCNPGFASLNLAMAVQLVAYELRLLEGGELPVISDPATELATADEVALFYEHLQRTLSAVGFLRQDSSPHVMRRLKRLFGRTRLEKAELNVLRGILAAVEQHEAS